MSDIYKANKRYDSRQKAEERILNAIKEMTTLEGKKVKDVATNPITRKEQLDAYRKEHPPTQDVDEQSRQETIEAVKKQLKDLGIDVTEIPEDQLQEFQWEHFSLTEGKKDKHKELVFADIECHIDDHRKFTPNLICFERETSDEKYHCWGTDWLLQFYKQLDNCFKEIESKNNLKSNQVEIQVYFHNFKGFDGVFIIKQLYDMNLKVEKVLMTGQKILYFECGRLKFKDSMSFLNMPFATDFEKECKFNPLKENITIASACHNFWRNHQMIPYSIAVEPPHGWSGIKPAQSKICFQWLHVQDQKLGGNRIKHAGNGGEQTLMIESWGKVHVDGYDPIKKTVYEFHGCEFHGCKRCKPNNRHVKTWHHPDRTVDEMYQLTQKKTETLRKAGYTVKEEWECKFNHKLASDVSLQDIVKDLTWVAPLNPKHALFGGRTGLSCCYHKTVHGERIDCVDYTSIVPVG